MTRNKFQCNKPLNGLCKKIILSAVVANSLVMATDVDVAKENPLVTHTEFGYIQTDGNTETKTFNLDSKATKNWQKHVLGFVFDGQYADDSGIETKNKFLTELTYGYEFTDRFAFTYLVGYKSDKFSSFDYQAYTGPGAKYKAIVSKNHNLGLEGNILYSMDEIGAIKYYVGGAPANYPYNGGTIDPSLTVPSDSDTYASYRLKGVYGWQMLENLKFDQEISYRSSFEDADKYFVFSKSALSSKINSMFSAGISYKLDYVNEAGDKENTDTTLTLNLIMDY